MFDGVARTLSGVLRVPNLKKHMIFLGDLDKDGLRFIDKGRVVKILKVSNCSCKG